MKNLFSIGVLCIALVMCSCGTSNVTIKKSTKRQTAQIGACLVASPTIADLDIISDSRVFYTETIKMSEFVGSTKPSQLDNIYYAKVLEKFGADVLVSKQVDVETTFTSKTDGTVKIVISGYPARYRNFRTMTESDNWMLNIPEKLVTMEKDAQSGSGLLDLFKKKK